MRGYTLWASQLILLLVFGAVDEADDACMVLQCRVYIWNDIGL